MGSQTISLNWSNHRKNMSTVFQHLFSTEAFVDVTLACEGLYLKAHKIILSASSQFFETLLLENPCQHPIVILTDMRYNDLTEIVNFMYQGMIEIAQDRLSEFLKTAERLKIKGLSVDSGNADYDSEQGENQSIPNLYIRKIHSDELQWQTSDNNEHLDIDKNDLDSVASFGTKTKSPLSSIKLEHSATELEVSDSEPLNEAEKCNPVYLPEYCDVSTDQESERNEIPIINQYTDSYSVEQGANAGLTFPEGADSQPITPSFSKEMKFESEENGIQDTTEVPMNEHTINDISMESRLCATNEVKAGYMLQRQEPFTSEDTIHTVQGFYDTISSKGDSLHCDVCGRIFGSVQNFSQHICTHVSSQQFPCAICNKTFLHKSSLRLHSRMHSGMRPFSCDVCGKTFGQREHLRTHFRIHSGEKPFTCNVCNKKFITKNHLTIHSRSHTGERPYGCSMCEKSYTKSSDLVSHVRVHTGEKPFKCNVCNKCFVQNSALKVHTMRIHYGNR